MQYFVFSRFLHSIGTGNTACGTIGNCAGKEDGLYPDPNCQTFYFCQNGNFQLNSRYYCPHSEWERTSDHGCNAAAVVFDGLGSSGAMWQKNLLRRACLTYYLVGSVGGVGDSGGSYAKGGKPKQKNL